VPLPAWVRDEVVRILYLHGFASSARSSKAAFFKQKLHELGVELETPDLNEPDFSTLTIARMVQQVLALLDGRSEPAVLIGSSLGAFVAVQVALARPAQVKGLILFAPALDFTGNRMKNLGSQGLDEWNMPIQVFQGRRDDAVDPVAVEQWSRARPNIELHLLDDDHQLTASVDYLWKELRRFLRLGRSSS
jgi:pimeloyl-ACP methyl ester carboxylesterase